MLPACGLIRKPSSIVHGVLSTPATRNARSYQFEDIFAYPLTKLVERDNNKSGGFEFKPSKSACISEYWSNELQVL